MTRAPIEFDKLVEAMEAAEAAQQAAAEAVEKLAAIVPAAQPEPAPARLTDLRVATSVRIEPNKLDELKILAVRKRVKVNDLILEGVDHVLALARQTSAGRAA